MKQFPFLVMMLVGLIMSCQTIQQTEKQAITRIFLENKNTFRGINLGDSLARIKKMEKIPPKHEDWLGLVYNYEVEKNCVMEVEYYADNVLTGEKTNRLKGIVANLTLKDEIATRV